VRSAGAIQRRVFRFVDERQCDATGACRRTGSGVGVDKDGCSPTQVRARCTCRSSWIRAAASTPASFAIAANQDTGVAITTADRRGREDAHLWRTAGASSSLARHLLLC